MSEFTQKFGLAEEASAESKRALAEQYAIREAYRQRIGNIRETKDILNSLLSLTGTVAKKYQLYSKYASAINSEKDLGIKAKRNNLFQIIFGDPFSFKNKSGKDIGILGASRKLGSEYMMSEDKTMFDILFGGQ